MSATRTPRTPKRTSAGARRQRWVIIVGGTPGPVGYVEWSDRATADTTEGPFLATRDEAVECARGNVRLHAGRVPVCVWRVGGRWPARSPTWYYDPRGLPEAWAPRGAPPPKHPLPACSCAEYGRCGDATPTRTCSVCGCPAVGGVIP